MTGRQRIGRLIVLGFVGTLAAGCRTVPSPAPAPDREPDGEDVEAGYVVQRRADVSASIATVTAEDVAHERVGRIEELLRGRVPGLDVGRRADGGYALHVRGASAGPSGGEPLVVLDGTPLVGPRAGDALSGLHPADVARIDVLKDAGATAIYGWQGVNGVVVITTRRR